jgi:hypothetical protein
MAKALTDAQEALRWLFKDAMADGSAQLKRILSLVASQLESTVWSVPCEEWRRTQQLGSPKQKLRACHSRTPTREHIVQHRCRGTPSGRYKRYIQLKHREAIATCYFSMEKCSHMLFLQIADASQASPQVSLGTSFPSHQACMWRCLSNSRKTKRMIRRSIDGYKPPSRRVLMVVGVDRF